MTNKIVKQMKSLLDQGNIEYKYYDNIDPDKRYFVLYWWPDETGKVVYNRTIVRDLI